jgi:uncharacterized protein (TIGR03032 family)
VTALLAPPSPSTQIDPDAFRYIHSTGFPAILERLNSSLLVSTYQLGKLALFRARHQKLTMLLRTFDKAMGLAVDRDRLAIGTKNSIWLLRNDATIAADLDPPGRHDACYLPRKCHVTGDIAVHEMAWGRDAESAGDEQIRSRRERATLWFINTKFSGLCTIVAFLEFEHRMQEIFDVQLLDGIRFPAVIGLQKEDVNHRYVVPAPFRC